MLRLARGQAYVSLLYIYALKAIPGAVECQKNKTKPHLNLQKNYYSLTGLIFIKLLKALQDYVSTPDCQLYKFKQLKSCNGQATAVVRQLIVSLQKLCSPAGVASAYIYLLVKYGDQLLAPESEVEPIDTAHIKRSLNFFKFYFKETFSGTDLNMHDVVNTRAATGSVFNWLTGNYFALFFLDLEYLTGLSICVQLNYIKRIVFSTRIRVFRTFFTSARRSW